jgi:hypothetical protein
VNTLPINGSPCTNQPYEYPIISDFQDYFDRDFQFTEDDCNLKQVRPKDIDKAFSNAKMNFSARFFSNQQAFTNAFLELSAHYLVTNLRASSQGISGQYTWLQAGKSAGPVSESFNIPQRILDNPSMAMLTKTNYGAKYLQLILPQLAGNVSSVHGRVHP